MSTFSNIRRAILTGSVLGVVAACSATEPNATSSATSVTETVVQSTSTSIRAVSTTRVAGAHIMPVRHASLAPRVTAPAGSHLKYYGGPVLANVKVAAVYWSSAVKYQTEMSAFYQAVVKTPYVDWLNEYDTPTQHIGRGSFTTSFVDPGAPSGTTVTNDQIQVELSRLLDAHLVPDNDGKDMLYMVHFPPGVSIKLDDSTSSCVQFCAYHNTYVHNDKNVYYGVMPDLGGGCAFGCGSDPAPGNLTAVSSHELIEAVTDGAVGLVPGNTPVAPMAWYDETNGEIGDICVGQTAKVEGATVQLEWSNHEGACIATRAACTAGCGDKQCGQDACGNPCGFCTNGTKCDDAGHCNACTPSCSGKTCGDDGCGGSCGTCSGTQTCGANGTCGTCTPSCNGTQCGQDDGCGGKCGCPSGKTCLPILNICL